MGWYASNRSDSFQYKYGDVVGLARACRLGSLRLAVRLEVLDDDGELIESEAFLGPLQAHSERQGRPWSPRIEFSREVDPSGESVIVPCDADVMALMKEWAAVVRANLDPLFATVRELAEYLDDDCDISELLLGIDPMWALNERDYPAFLDWLNEPLEAPARFTLADLRQGEIDDDWYVGPAIVQAALPRLKDDRPRQLGLQAFGHALTEGEELALFQPSDDFMHSIWARANDE